MKETYLRSCMKQIPEQQITCTDKILMIETHMISLLISVLSMFDWPAHSHRLNIIHPYDRSPRRNICPLIYHNSDRKVSNYESFEYFAAPPPTFQMEYFWLEPLYLLCLAKVL